MIKSFRHWFTLVELIVVITILAILGTIGFISMQGYSQSAREATRISDLATIEKALTFFHTTENYFPEPTDFINITYSGSLAWKQGVFGEDTRLVVGRISESPRDPLTNSLYAYSVTNNRQEFELWAISETPLAAVPSLTNTTYADNNYFTNVVWNYNKQIVTVKEPTRLYILWVPTLITSEITDVTVQDILARGTFSVKNSKSLPASYTNNLPEWQTLTGATSFTPWTVTLTAPLIYDGSAESLNDDTEKQVFADNLVSYYQGSNLDNNDRKDLKNVTTWDELTYVNTLIQNDTGWIPGENIQINTSNTASSAAAGTIPFISTWKSGNPDWYPDWDNPDLNPNQILIVTGDTEFDYSLYYENINDAGINWTMEGLTWDAIIYVPTIWTYRVEITGKFSSMPLWFNAESQQKIISVEQWGNVGWETMYATFVNAENLVSVPNNTNWLEWVEDMSYMFWYLDNFSQDLNNWNTSNVTNMYGMFAYNTQFNGDISTWNTGNVTNFSNMFNNAIAFNQDLNWEMRNAENISAMFFEATSFMGDISSWNTEKVTNMATIFYNARNFAWDISSWDTWEVTDMTGMFYYLDNFNADISNWNTAKVTNMKWMFSRANSFNRDISNWDTWEVTDMQQMFNLAISFNQDLSSWCVSKVTSRSNFDNGTSAWTGKPATLPSWGSCPADTASF